MAQLHQAQNQIARSSVRFKVLRCGRRFRKTTYAVEEIEGTCLFAPAPVAYFATTRDQARDIVWEELLSKVRDTANFVSSNEQRLEVVLSRPDGSPTRSGSSAGREIIRPTLADYRGAPLIMGTPKGYKSLYRLETLFKTNPSYVAFHFTSFRQPAPEPR